jgi:hypothetical protein
MRKLRKSNKLLIVFMLCAAVLSACENGSTTATPTSEEATTAQTAAAVSGEPLVDVSLPDLVTFDDEDYAADWSADTSTVIALSGTGATITGTGAEAKDGAVTITAAGIYVLSGKLSEGQIVVDVQDKGTVRLVLNGVDIHDSDSAPIYVKEAGKAIITLQDGTENIVTDDGTAYVLADASADEPNAAIFSKADLTINGTGKLSVTGNYNNGITSKDNLKIMEGTIRIQAHDDGILGRDLVAVADGSINVKAEGDGVMATNDTDATKGIIAIAGGKFDIQAGADGIQAETTMLINGGTYTIVTGGGNVNGEVHMEERGGPRGMAITTEATTSAEDTESTSTKGLKAGGDLIVNNGTFTIDSADDTLHSNGNIAINGGEIGMATGEDAIHADAQVIIAGGKIDITKSYEGIEGTIITINGGEVHVAASDDGTNASGENGSNQLNINGGILYVDSAGDGLDANGSVKMTGGTAIVNGPTSSGNGSLDYDGTFEMTGGILVAAGSAGMVQAPSEDSSQYSIVMSFPQTQAAGTLVNLADSAGNSIVTFAPSKEYQAVAISSPDLKEGSYVLSTGGSTTGSEANGLYAAGTYEGGTKVVEFDISKSITWLNESGVTTAAEGHGGGGMRPGGGMRGQKPAFPGQDGTDTQQ